MLVKQKMKGFRFLQKKMPLFIVRLVGDSHHGRTDQLAIHGVTVQSGRAYFTVDMDAEI